ncbi:Recombinase zinc beta ribbon domain-containing protein [Blastococcus tunisiensis]|uniref:Recombinase zinc beta ribbon domain-containing protein n=1 Tax=Blastococcus tunisiensis TaxID=1798228 RepID=A0A1I2JEK6_9ACTN|nr:Recombinase zinc beta ribbon domain-containing protein [Blastococcus sp. DSM 46838]
MTTERTAIVYVRLSSHRGEADPSTSPERQEAACRAYAAAKGWHVIDVVRDLDVSGSDKGLRLDRPGLHAIRDRWADVDVVIFAKLDRLARNVIDFRAFADEAEQHGAALVSVAESLDLTTPSGRFVATILAAFAEMEAATIAARVADGIDGVRRAGRFAGGNVPYGYRTAANPDGPGRVLVPDPDESAVVRQLVATVLDGGSLYAAAQDLNARGIRPRRAKEWSIQSVRQLLVGDAILGRVVHRGDVLRGDDGLPVVAWTPLVTVDEAMRLRAALAPKPAGERRRRAARLASGLLRCSGCDAPLRVGVNGAGVPTYRCATRSSGRLCPSPVSVNADAVDDLLTAELLATVGRFEVVDVITSAPEVAGLAEVEEAIRATAARMADPSADVPALVERLTALRARREELAAQPAAPTTTAVPSGETFAERWARVDVDGRRALLADAIAAVVVRPGVRGRRGVDASRLRIDWREGGGDAD